MTLRSLRRGRGLAILAVLGASLTIGRAPASHVQGGPTHFFTVSDGTSIALSVVFPDSYNPAAPGATKYPTIFEMAGYENGAASPQGRTYLGETADHFCADYGFCQEPPLAGDSHAGTSAFRYDADYVTVHAQVRGTGCSAGEFDLFSLRSAVDGKEIIDNWIAKQPWSNKKVGILGHSYSGMTGFMVASTQPRNLTSITVSGLIDDLYRGITYPGGVANTLFPPLWTIGIRPAYDVAGGTAQPLIRHGADPISQQCALNVTTHRRTVVNDPVVQGVNDTDNDWWRARSMITYAKKINKPIHITGAYQDEQTGPRFPHLWEAVPTTVRKRLLMMNGSHGTQVSPVESWADRKAWMDYFMRGVANPFVDPATTPRSVRTLFEMHSAPGGLVSNGIKDSTTFPLNDTSWTPFFLNDGGTLTTTAATAAGSGTYVSGSKRQSWSYEAGPEFGPPFTTQHGPDQLEFKSAAFTANTAIAGPITANLFLSTTAPDTELFVQVIDENTATGELSFLQRGLLRGSHRAVDLLRSDYDPLHADPLNPAKRFMYRPFRPHTSLELLTPNQVYEFLVEIFPLGHVFRPGHRLVVRITAPPAIDSSYAYPSKSPPALNTVHFSKFRKSRVTLPIVSLSGVTLGPELGCGQQHQVRCVAG